MSRRSTRSSASSSKSRTDEASSSKRATSSRRRRRIVDDDDDEDENDNVEDSKEEVEVDVEVMDDEEEAGKGTFNVDDDDEEIEVAVAAAAAAARQSEEEDDDEDDYEEDKKASRRSRSRSRTSSRSSSRAGSRARGRAKAVQLLADSDSEHDDVNMEVIDDEDDRKPHAIQSEGTVLLCSQIPEMSQSIREARPAEVNNYMRLSEEAREKAAKDLSRLVLFRALMGDSIDRLKCAKEAGINDSRMASAVFVEANRRLKNCFGFELARIPTWMEKVKALPKAYKDRYFLINTLKNDASGAHSKAIFAVHEDVMVENALLLMILAFAYCEGIHLVDGSRWIFDRDLFRHLHRLDDSIPSEPPAPNDTRSTRRVASGDPTPDVDVLLEKFVRRDYLLREKANEDLMSQRNGSDENSNFYSIGPRAAMEIGRQQILFMCAEIMGVEPDQETINELRDDAHEEDDDHEAVEDA
jgi:MAGE family